MADYKPINQSSLGEHSLVPKNPGMNIDRIVMAKVTAVHYKYGTVDVQLTRDNTKFSSSPNSKGRYSAKLPREFSGTTENGKSFGSVKPIQVGTLVIIGFINGSKNSPIVLSVYGTEQEAKELNRSDIDDVYGKSGDLYKQVDDTFTVYPNLTYDFVGGNGSRTMSFPGQSFLAIDPDDNKMSSGLFDDMSGSPYDSLGSSHYATGELIEPLNMNKPTFLFKQSGMDSSGDDKNHFIAFLDEEGNYRVSTVREGEDWRSYYQMSNNGDILLRRQNDSSIPGNGSDSTSIQLNKDDITLRAGDKFWVFGKDGLNGNGGGVGGAGGGESVASPEQLAELGEKLNQEIYKMRTYIEQDFESIKLGAEKDFKDLADDITNRFVEQDAELQIKADSIVSSVEELRLAIDESVDASLKDYTDNLNALNEEAGKTLEQFRNMFEDDVVSPLEKKQLAVEWESIKAEYLNYTYQGLEMGLNTDAYSTAYNKLKEVIEPVLENMTSPSDIDSVDFLNRFTNYYTERSNLLYSVISELNNKVTELARQFADNSIRMNDTISSLVGINGRSVSINNLLNDIASDNVLTFEEQLELEHEVDRLKSDYELLKGRLEHGSDANDREPIEIDTTELDEAYQTLMTKLNGYRIYPPTRENISVDGEELKNTFRTYLSEFEKFTQGLTTTLFNKMAEFQEDMEYYNTDIVQTKKKIELMADSVVAQGSSVKMNTARLYVMADRIGSSVTKTTLRREINEGLNILNTLGRNLFVITKANRGDINQSGSVTLNSNGKLLLSQPIEVNPMEYITLSTAEEEPVAFTVTFTDLSGNPIKTFSQEVTKEEPYTFTTPNKLQDDADASKMYVGIDYVEGYPKVKVEKNTNATSFAYAPEDSLGSIAVAKKEQESRELEFKMVQARVNQSRADSERMLSELSIYLEDYVLTPREKEAIKAMGEELDAEFSEIVKYGNDYNVNTLNYEGAYQALKPDFVSMIESMDTSTPVIAPPILRNLRQYQENRQTILDTVEGRVKQALDVVNESLEEMNANAIEAERRARILAQDAEAQARNTELAYQNYMESQELERTYKDIVFNVTEDSILSIEDKVQLESILNEIEAEQESLFARANVYGISTTDLQNTFNALDSTMSQYFVPEVMSKDDTEIDKSTIRNVYNNYMKSQTQLLKFIFEESQNKYKELSEQSTQAYDQASMLSEEIAVVRNAITDSRLMLEEVNRKIEGLRNQRNYMVSLTSTNGTIFKNNVIDTELKAQLFYGEKEITHELSNDCFVWTKRDSDGNEDTVWNRIHEGIGPNISITHEDVQGRATFKVEVFSDEMEVSS